MPKRTIIKSKPTRFFRVKNFERYQHYKKRNPPWVKLHREILDDDKFIFLSIEARHHYVTLLLIASSRNNVIPLDLKYLKKVMRLDEEPDLTPLFEAGFLIALSRQQASKMLEDRRQNALSETETETEKKRDREKREEEGLGEGGGPPENANTPLGVKDVNQGINMKRSNQVEKEKTQAGGDRRATDEDAFKALEKLRANIGSPRKDEFQHIGNPLKAF